MTASTEQLDTFRGCGKSCLCVSCLRNSKRCCVYCRGWGGFLIPTGRDSFESWSLSKIKSTVCTIVGSEAVCVHYMSFDVVQRQKQALLPLCTLHTCIEMI